MIAAAAKAFTAALVARWPIAILLVVLILFAVVAAGGGLALRHLLFR